MNAVRHLLHERVTLSPDAQEQVEVWARVVPEGATIETDETQRARVVRRYRILLRREGVRITHGQGLRWSGHDLVVESHAIDHRDRRLLVLDCREEVA